MRTSKELRYLKNGKNEYRSFYSASPSVNVAFKVTKLTKTVCYTYAGIKRDIARSRKETWWTINHEGQLFRGETRCQAVNGLIKFADKLAALERMKTSQ